MKKNEITKELIHAIKEVQKKSGRPWQEIGSDTKPFGGVLGFDSLNGLEVAADLSESLDCELPVENLFFSREENRALTVSEISDYIYRTCLEAKDEK